MASIMASTGTGAAADGAFARLLASMDKPEAVLGLCTMLYRQMPIHLGIERVSHGGHAHEKRVHFFKGGRHAGAGCLWGTLDLRFELIWGRRHAARAPPSLRGRMVRAGARQRAAVASVAARECVCVCVCACPPFIGSTGPAAGVAGKKFVEFVKNCKTHGLEAVATDADALALGGRLLNFRNECAAVAAPW